MALHKLERHQEALNRLQARESRASNLRVSTNMLTDVNSKAFPLRRHRSGDRDTILMFAPFLT